MSSLLPSIEFETGANPDATVIILHGLGADGNDFVPIVEELGLPAHLRVRFVFPHAPVRRVTVNGGHAMRAWYDIASPDLTNRADLAGVRESHAQVEALLAREEARGIAPSRTVVAGFSQGGAIALYTGLRHAPPLAGIVALSTYLIGGDTLPAAACEGTPPIFMVHGSEDPVVQFGWAEASRQRLEALGYDVEWRAYRMGHTVVAEEIAAISTFLARVLG